MKKKIELIISTCKGCPHFSRTTGRRQIPSCCYGKSYQPSKELPSRFIEYDYFTGHSIYEVETTIPDWCPLDDLKSIT